MLAALGKQASLWHTAPALPASACQHGCRSLAPLTPPLLFCLSPVCVQGLVLLLCALGPEEMSEVRLGPLTPHAVRTLRHIREFFNVQFRCGGGLCSEALA